MSSQQYVQFLKKVVVGTPSSTVDDAPSSTVDDALSSVDNAISSDEPPSHLPVSGKDAVQSPNDLQDSNLGLILPLSWLGLVSIFMVHHWLSSRRNST